MAREKASTAVDADAGGLQTRSAGGEARRVPLHTAAADLSRRMARAGHHAEQAIAHELEVMLGAVRTRAAALQSDHPEVAALLAAVRATV